MTGVHQILVKLLDGDTRCVHLPSPSLSGGALKLRLHALTGIPPESQFILSGSRVVHDDTLIHAFDGSFPSCSLLLRLRGGKGGFGSLLRGAATKAGQKKTNNFDACRDMSGRRLRHVNAERRLEEWKAEAEQRRLEKVAEEFLRKKAKETKKKDGGEIDKYVQRCKAISERCMGEVDDSVRSSFALYEQGKRKAFPAAGTSASKRLKIWLGKNKVDASDSEDEEDDGDSEDEKSMVVDEGNLKDEVGCSATISEGNSCYSPAGGDPGKKDEENSCSDENRSEEGQLSGSGDSHIESVDSAEMKETVTEDLFLKRFTCESVKSTNDSLVQKCEGPAKSEGLPKEEVKAHITSTYFSEALVTPQKAEINDDSSEIMKEAIFPTTTSSLGVLPEITPTSVSERSTSKNSIEVQKTTHMTPVSNSMEALKLEKFSSASELEVLGLERLKVELQANGLKCGGTLQERATRLFLLKTIPFDMLPKKVLAKSSGGGK